MKRLGLARHAIGTALIAVALVFGLAAIDRRTGVFGGTSSVALAVGTAGFVDLLVYALMACGLVIAKTHFMQLWLVSILAKFGCLGLAVLSVWLGSALDTHRFALALAASFVAFSHHEAFRLASVATEAHS